MKRPLDQALALERGRWLAELARAIDEAQRVAWTLGVSEGDSAVAKELYARLELVRGEIEELRFGDWTEVPKEIDPSWIQTLLDGTKFVRAAN